MAAVHRLEFVACVFGPPVKSTCWSLSFYKTRLESMQHFR